MFSEVVRSIFKYSWPETMPQPDSSYSVGREGSNRQQQCESPGSNPSRRRRRKASSRSSGKQAKKTSNAVSATLQSESPSNATTGDEKTAAPCTSPVHSVSKEGSNTRSPEASERRSGHKKGRFVFRRSLSSKVPRLSHPANKSSNSEAGKVDSKPPAHRKKRSLFRSLSSISLKGRSGSEFEDKKPSPRERLYRVFRLSKSSKSLKALTACEQTLNDDQSITSDISEGSDLSSTKKCSTVPSSAASKVCRSNHPPSGAGPSLVHVLVSVGPLGCNTLAGG